MGSLKTDKYTMVRRSKPLLIALSVGMLCSLAAQEDYFESEEPAIYLAQNNAPVARNNRERQLYGFADTPWKATFANVRDKFQKLATARSNERVEILNIEENHHILIKRNDITYRYGFYKTPLEVARLENHQITEEEQEQVQALLFHVKIILPFIEASRIKQQIQVLYGPNSRSTLDEKTATGADIWEKPGGFIFQWYEPYKGKAFTRTIDYLSREVSQVILKEYEDYFDAREKLLLKKLRLD